MALTYRYGRIKSFVSNFYLCENDVQEKVSTRNDESEEMTGLESFRNNGFNKEESGFAAYNKETDSWQSNKHGTPMDTAEPILAKYPHVD